MKHKLSLRIILWIGVTLLLSSCGYKDIDKRFFVVTIGVDKAHSEDKKYKVMLKLAIPATQAKMGDSEFIVSQHESNSITDAVRKIKSKVDKELDFSHAKAIVFGEDVLQKDIQELLDWFIRRRDIQKIAWVAIAKPNAEEILKMKRLVERSPSNSLFLSFGKTGTESTYIISEYLFDFRSRITERGIDPILPIMISRGNYYEVNTVGILDHDRLRMPLTQEETKYLNVLLNRSNKTDIRVERQGGEDAFLIDVDVAKVKYKIKQEPRPTVKVEVKMEGLVEEVLDEIAEDNLKECKELAEQQTKERILHVLKKLQKEELDPLGLGLRYRAGSFRKDDWKEWQKLYPEIVFDVHVDVTIQGTGLLKGL